MTAKERRLWQLFRLTPKEQEQIETYQRKHPVYSKLLGGWNGTDHNHATGQVRGRLDFRINRAYGMIEKAFPYTCAQVLEALAEYHRNPPAVLALGRKVYGLIGQAKVKKKMVYGGPQPPAPARKRKAKKNGKV